MTNYEKIKSMSVDEMTAFIITKLAFFPCELCEREHNASCTHEDCFNIHKKWLESEAEPTYCKDKQNKLVHCEDCHEDC